MKLGITTVKKKERSEMLAEVATHIRFDSDESDFILISVQTFFDPFDEMWTANLSYYED